MEDHELREFTRRKINLDQRLLRSPRVAHIASLAPGRTVESLADEASHGLLDIEESARRLRDVLLPRLEAAEPESEEFEAVLMDIAEEYKHIHYHLVNSRIFNYGFVFDE